MRLWRLSGAAYANRFDGGFGRSHEGRWNSPGHPATYCSTGPAVCVLEKLVHIEDPLLLPDDTMLVCYEVPDDVVIESLLPDQVPDDWRNLPQVTRAMGDAWLQGVTAALWRLPSVVVPIAYANDWNLLVNHMHEDAGRISIFRIDRFEYDPRLFWFGD